MEKEMVTLNSEATVAEAAKKIAENPRGYALIMSEGIPVGIVTEKNLIKEVLAKGLSPSKIKISKIMSTPLITIDPDEELTKAAETMRENKIRKLPVVRDGIVYGIITARDITDHFNEYVTKVIREVAFFSSYRF
jgi:CBS domain-containing protein